MLKAVARDERGPMYIFGLSGGNVKKLKQGKPIKINLEEVGGEGTVLIMYGSTEAHMLSELAEFIGPDTKLHIEDGVITKQ